MKLPGTPGGRWDLKVDLSPWEKRGLRLISTERPGFGASTRLPGRQFHEHADDLAAILDQGDVERAYLIGGSGAAPHILSFLSRHPDRCIAASISAGAAPLEPNEVEDMIEMNRSEWHFVQCGDRGAVEAALRPEWVAQLADPWSAFSQILDRASESDRKEFEERLDGPGALAAIDRGNREALSTEENFQAWIDETFALALPWDDIILGDIRTSITWYHGQADAAAPFSAAERLVERISTATLVDIGSGAGHTAGVGDSVRLDELLARG